MFISISRAYHHRYGRATSIHKIKDYTKDLEKDEFLKKSLVFDAVTLNLQIIGEASKNIPENVRNQYPEIPWRNIIGLRNIGSPRVVMTI